VKTTDAARRGVGPVLQDTPFAEEVVLAIQDENDDVVVHHEGAYLRVLVPGVCRLSRAAVQAVSGRDVHFPGDLELIMSSFTGLMRLTDQAALWWIGDGTPPETFEEDGD
jgi:toluene monooxygenase system protein D